MKNLENIGSTIELPNSPELIQMKKLANSLEDTETGLFICLGFIILFLIVILYMLNKK